MNQTEEKGGQRAAGRAKTASLDLYVVLEGPFAAYSTLLEADLPHSAQSIDAQRLAPLFMDHGSGHKAAQYRDDRLKCTDLESVPHHLTHHCPL
jgi:hypothetical protein